MMSGGGGEINSMRDDFPRVLQQAEQAISEAVGQVRRYAAEITDGSPSHQAVKDAAAEWATALEALAGKGDEIHGLSRQADATGWQAAEQYGSDPNGPKWLK